MTGRISQASDLAMKGGGYYSQSTRGAKDVIDNASGMLMEAVAALPDAIRERYLDRSGSFADTTGADSRRRLQQVAEEAVRERVDSIQARIESGGYIRVGLDDFALKVLGEADALDLPLMGKELDQSKAGWGLRRKDNLADVLSPIDGVIMEVNSKVRENPKLANHEPYGDGWLFMVRTPDVKGTMKQLMVDQQSLSWMNTEVSELEGMIEEVAGPLAADGGYLADDIYGNLPDLGWKNLTKKFLRT